MSKTNLKRIILLGPPGAGKSTQGRLLAKKLKIPWISIGELLRESYQKGYVEGNEWWIKYGSKGLNAPIELKFSILEKRLISAKNGFVLDDFPRTREDLDALKGYLDWSKVKIDKVILIDVSERTSVRRILRRWRIAKKRGIERYDDSPYVLKVRIKEGYKKELPIMLQYFEKQKLLVNVEGNGRHTIREVYKKILSALHAND